MTDIINTGYGMEVVDNKSIPIDFEGEETLNPSISAKSSSDSVYPNAVLNIVRDTASVFQLKRKWEKCPPLLDLTPPFQRELVWTKKTKM